MRRTISFALLLAILILAFASCGKKEDVAFVTTAATAEAAKTTGQTEPSPTGTTAAQTTAEPTTVATTTDPWESIGTEVSAFSESDRSFRIELSEYSNAEKTSKNDQYVVGPDSIEGGMVPTLERLVYERNQAAKELLGVQIDYVYWDYRWGKQTGQIKSVVQGQAADAPDLFVNMIYDLNNALLFSSFKDAWSIPGSYFDFEKQGWMTEWMESMSVTHDRNYILAGDYFVDVLRAMAVLPFNLTMMDANADQLAAFILESGQSMTEGEKLSEYFFDFVDDGKWTWPVLGQLCEAIWVDTDGDGADSIGDTLGIIGDISSKLSSAIYLYSCGEKGIFNEYIIEDPTSEYNNETWVAFPADSSALGRIFDSVSAVYIGKGSLATAGGYEGATTANPGIAYHRIKFAEGTLLTAGACVLGALEDDAFQTMRDMYSVVPLPKLSEDRDYNTLIHNIGDAGAINVNTTKAVVLSAFLQYSNEHSAEIRDEFLEVVTKYKTTRYNQGTDRMLTLIYDSVITGRDKMIEDAVASSGSNIGNYKWHSILDAEYYTTTSADLVELYQSAVAVKQDQLNRVLTAWYSLPKVEANAE